jgi:hypothetical protein
MIQNVRHESFTWTPVAFHYFHFYAAELHVDDLAKSGLESG